MSAALEAVTVRTAGVILLYQRHAQPGNLMPFARIQRNELDARTKRRKIDRKRWRRLLSAQRRLEVGMSTVEEQPIAGNVRRPEKRQPHDVVPMHMGHEDVIGLR